MLEAAPAAEGTWVLPAGLSLRDRAILDLTRRLTRDPRSFAETIRALYEATTAIIPAGRIYVLGTRGDAPIYGSLVSGVGLVETRDGLRVLRVPR